MRPVEGHQRSWTKQDVAVFTESAAVKVWLHLGTSVPRAKRVAVILGSFGLELSFTVQTGSGIQWTKEECHSIWAAWA